MLGWREFFRNIGDSVYEIFVGKILEVEEILTMVNLRMKVDWERGWRWRRRWLEVRGFRDGEVRVLLYYLYVR